MGIDALTHRDNGSEAPKPETPDEWLGWVSAGRTRNWILKDPLLDWLHLYGRSRGFIPKQELPGYDAELDFHRFVLQKGREFEAGILRLLAIQCEVSTISSGYEDIRKLDKAEETFAAMCRGAPIIYQPVLRDAENLNYGAPDLLVRSDILAGLFPDAFPMEGTSTADPDDIPHFPAPDLNDAPWHYRVVDIKFATLRLNAAGTQLGNNASSQAYKVLMYVYNRMLGRLQGFLPPMSYLLGRGWSRTQQGIDYRGANALEKLAPIPQHGTIANGTPIASAVDSAMEWVRRVRSEGGEWDLLPTPSVPELYPNMSGQNDDLMTPISVDGVDSDEGELPLEWKNVKSSLAAELKELTLLWQVGPDSRREAHRKGIRRWDDPRLDNLALGIMSKKRGATLKKLLDVNRCNGPRVLPQRIEKTRKDWMHFPGIEFYVDFESCNDLNDDFSRLPQKGGQPLIFMIGCGHMEEGRWQFRTFVVDNLSEDEELRIIQEWFWHMTQVHDRLDPKHVGWRIFHWGHAEPTMLNNAYNSAWERHNHPADWPVLDWYDLLQKVVREEPVVVKGALGFGLKDVANAMYAEGLIETHWADSRVDGLGAMLGAWRCDENARLIGMPMSALPTMEDIARYNEVDCKVMMEIVRYLKTTH